MNTTQNTQTQVTENAQNAQNAQNVESIYSGFLRRLIDLQLDMEEQLEKEDRSYWYEDTLQELFWGLREKINETMDSSIEEQLRGSRK